MSAVHNNFNFELSGNVNVVFFRLCNEPINVFINFHIASWWERVR